MIKTKPVYTRRAPDKPKPSEKPETKKLAVSIRIDDDILTWFKAQGPGYQTRINAALRKHVGLA